VRLQPTPAGARFPLLQVLALRRRQFLVGRPDAANRDAQHAEQHERRNRPWRLFPIYWSRSISAHFRNWPGLVLPRPGNNRLGVGSLGRGDDAGAAEGLEVGFPEIQGGQGTIQRRLGVVGTATEQGQAATARAG
jgi:hypothetical protein